MTTSTRTLCDSSPFHLVPCSPYVGTTISGGSPALRAVPDVGETAETDSPRTIAGQYVPHTPVFHNADGPSHLQNLICTTPSTQRAATPEQEVPKTPIPTNSSAKTKTLQLAIKINSTVKTTPPRKDDTREINLFNGDDSDIFG